MTTTMGIEQPDELLKLTEIARLMGVRRATVARWVRDGRLPAVQTPGGHWRVRSSEVDAMLKNAVRTEDE